MRKQVIVLAAALVMAPLGAKAADLVVWWEKGYYAQEDEAVREIVAAFEQETGKQVELVFQSRRSFRTGSWRRSRPDRPPDFAFGIWLGDLHSGSGPSRIGWWTSRTPSVISRTCSIRISSTVPCCSTQGPGRGRCTACRSAQISNHIHVWKSLLEQAGFTLEDIPKEWEAFWSFWCDEVQPAVRRATGRDDIWGVGLAMSAEAADTETSSFSSSTAYEADYVTPDGRLVIDDPEIRRKLVKAIDSYTAIYRKGCTPPNSVTWADIGNNKAFHAQTVVMTPNHSLSIPNALKRERPEDYYKNTATIEWPLGPSGKPFPIRALLLAPWSSRTAAIVATAKEFVRFLVAEGWLAHYLDFSGERMLPPMPKLLEAPFWLDPSDPHRMAAAMQAASATPQLTTTPPPRATAARPDLATSASGEGGPPHRHRGHQPRAGGRRGDRPDQGDPERVADPRGG